MINCKHVSVPKQDGFYKMEINVIDFFSKN